MSEIEPMATELGLPAPQAHDRLTADVVFRKLRERVAAQRAKDRSATTKPERRRHRIVASLNAGGKSEVYGEHRPVINDNYFYTSGRSN